MRRPRCFVSFGSWLALAVPVMLAPAFSTSAKSAEAGVSIYGISLKEPLAIPECDEGVTPLRPPELGGKLPTKMCFASWENILDQPPPQDEFRDHFVFFGPVKPAIADYIGFNVVTLGGMVQAVNVSTGGLTVQQEVLTQLVAKFGQPNSVTQEEITNRGNEAELVTHAVWLKTLGTDLVYVSFIGATNNSPDRGMIIAQTNAAFERAHTQSESTRKLLESREPKL